MKDDLGILDKNWLVHQDLHTDCLTKANGLFTFVLRVNDGEICDYLMLENDGYSDDKVPPVRRA